MLGAPSALIQNHGINSFYRCIAVVVNASALPSRETCKVPSERHARPPARDIACPRGRQRLTKSVSVGIPAGETHDYNAGGNSLSVVVHQWVGREILAKHY